MMDYKNNFTVILLILIQRLVYTCLWNFRVGFGSAYILSQA